MERALHPILRRRDPAFIERIRPLLDRLVHTYFRAEVEGAEHLSERASLVVGTHNGGIFMPDMLALLLAFWQRYGPQAPSFGLVHRFVERVPGLRGFLGKIGGVIADPQHAQLVLEHDFPLLIFPGGEVDALKPFRHRHRVVMGGRRGFIRLAILKQVPVIPVVSTGAHELFIVLHEGRTLARWSGATRLLGVKTVPLTLSFPFGITPAGLLALPFPAKVRVRVLAPLRFAVPAAAANDDAVVDRCFDEVQRVMQNGLDELAARGKRQGGLARK